MKDWVIDAVGLVGAACLIGGVAWLNYQAGLIVAGVLFLAFAILHAQNPNDRRG